MASIHREISIDAPPEQVWLALRDWAALHERLAPGFVTDVRLDGSDRIVTFFNGSVVRERLIDLDDGARRIAWSITGGPYTHHNGSAQVFAEGDGGTRFTWIADLLPHELAAGTAQMMEQGLRAIKQAQERAPRTADPAPSLP
jgi:carbon monoxide dehydrogenase subunit G